MKFFGKFNLHKNCNQTCWSKNFFRTTSNDFWSSTATYSLPDWQAITLTFFAPYSGHENLILWEIRQGWKLHVMFEQCCDQYFPITCGWVWKLGYYWPSRSTLVTDLKNIFLMYSPGLKLTITFLSLTGLLIFRAVAEPWNSGISAKSCKIHKNMKNTAKFGRNLIKYMSVQHIWNLFQL